MMKLGLTYHNAFDFARSHRAYDAGFALWQQAGQVLPTDSPSVGRQVLRMDWASPKTLDPIKQNYWAARGVIRQLFSGLVALSPELDIVPDVAQSWEVLDEGHRYVFHLREKACWSDGAPLTAEDFIFAWNRKVEPGLGPSQVPEMGPGRSLLQQYPEIRRAYAAGRHTLVVELDRPIAHFLFLPALWIAYPVPRHVLEAHGESWTEPGTMVWNGPFVLESWEPGRSLVVARNPAYHGHFKGNVQRVELAIFTEPEWEARLALYEADKLDLLHLWMLPLLEMDRARQRCAGEYLTGPWQTTGCMWYDVSRPPFDDRRVRRAFVLAADRERLANVLQRGFFAPATGGFLGPSMPGHTPGMGLPFDPAQARRLLAEAGYPEGRGFPCIDLTTWAWPGNEAICAFLQAQWRENLGVQTTWESLGEDKIWEKWTREPPHIFPWYPGAAYPDPSSVLRKPFYPQRTHWRDKAYERLIEQAATSTDQEKRLQLYRQADRLLIEEAVCIPLFYFRSHLLVKPWVRQVPIWGIRMFWKDVIIQR
jgi:oligopeptide transport system substrate-binding protein